MVLELALVHMERNFGTLVRLIVSKQAALCGITQAMK